MARQHGNSRQGPDNLDEAQRNQGRSGQSSSDDEFESSSGMSASSSNSPSRSQDVSEDEIEGAYASSSSSSQDTEQVLADGELVGDWSEDEEESGLTAGSSSQSDDSYSASDETSEELDDRSMRAHGSDRADGQHGLTGSGREPGSGPRHR